MSEYQIYDPVCGEDSNFCTSTHRCQNNNLQGCPETPVKESNLIYPQCVRSSFDLCRDRYKNSREKFESCKRGAIQAARVPWLTVPTMKDTSYAIQRYFPYEFAYGLIQTGNHCKTSLNQDCVKNAARSCMEDLPTNYYGQMACRNGIHMAMKLPWLTHSKNDMESGDAFELAEPYAIGLWKGGELCTQLRSNQ